MTIEELNKLIKEELDSFLNEEEGGDDIEVTTDEPAAETGEEAMDLLRQIYDMIKPEIEGEEEPEDEDEGEELEGEEGEEEAEEEELEEGVLNEDLLSILEPVYKGMMDQNVLNKAMSDAKFVKIIASTILFWATVFGISARQGIANILKTVARRGTESMKKMANSILGNEDLLVKLSDEGDDAIVDEAVGYSNYRADQISKVKADADDINKGLNESIDQTARFKKLANIKK